jgi:isoprenylcysteine carboxyl methyltransferase (ICMT) family protein YpbQ
VLFVPLAAIELIRAWFKRDQFFALVANDRFRIGRIFVKTVGLIATYGVCMAYYWLLPVYNGSFYRPFLDTAYACAPYLVVAGIIYVAVLDRHMGHVRDGYFEVGKLCLGHWRDRDWETIRQHWLGWLVKVFFLPLMFGYLLQNLQETRANFLQMNGGFIKFYFFFFSLMFLIDLVFVVMGYICTFRVTDSHIRTTEGTLFGWVVTIACYDPFWSLINRSYINYGSYRWDAWLATRPDVQVIWGSAILLCLIVYTWSSVCFGLRFSNLTYRGLIAHGPYRFTKHPAYVSKNISWWLISVPFVANSTAENALRQCLLLLALNFVYYLRAYTEELHLSRYPEYREYLRYMDQQDILRWIPKPGFMQRKIPRHE